MNNIMKIPLSGLGNRSGDYFIIVIISYDLCRSFKVYGSSFEDVAIG